MVQWVGLFSAPSLSSTVVCVVALTPGQAIDEALAPGWSSALSLFLAMAHRSQWALALPLRWALADAPHSGVMVGWALGLEWGWCCRRRWPLSGDPQDTSTHSTYSAKLPQGHSPDNCARVAVFSKRVRTCSGSRPGRCSDGWDLGILPHAPRGSGSPAQGKAGKSDP